MNKEKIKGWLRSRENQLLVLLLVFTIAIRLYYFFKLGSQPIWWDEGDYLSIPKVWSLGMERPEWWIHFTGIRPLLMPIIWFLFFKLHLGEASLRFITILIPSILSVYLVYAIGRDMYNKKIGLISGFFMSVYWVHLFYSFRILTDIPALFLGLLTIYFFYSKYILKKQKLGLYLSVLFGVLTFATRFPHASVLFTCFLFLLIIQRKNFFKKKTNWKALLLILLLLSPYIIYFAINQFYALQFYFGPEATNLQTPLSDSFKKVFGLFPMLFGPGLSFFKNVFFIFFFIGILTLFKAFLGFDLFWKQKDQRFNADFFIILWVLIQLILYVLVIRSANDRWLLMLMPPMFFIVSKGLCFIEKTIKKYSKHLATFILIALVLVGGFYQIKHANALIELKKDTYGEIKLAGVWIKENTPKDAKIITASIVQNQYYSERQSYDFYTNGTHNKTLFEKKIKRIDPDYLILSIFEPNFTPQWAYGYPQEKNLELVKAYIADKEYQEKFGVPEGTAILLLYKF